MVDKQQVGRVPDGTGLSSSTEPASSLGPSGFDPSRCQWCGDDGFDLKGLAEHVWRRCEVVERLAEENIEDVRAWHQRNWEEAQRRKAHRDSDGSPKGGDGEAGSVACDDSAGRQASPEHNPANPQG